MTWKILYILNCSYLSISHLKSKVALVEKLWKTGGRNIGFHFPPGALRNNSVFLRLCVNNLAQLRISIPLGEGEGCQFFVSSAQSKIPSDAISRLELG